jgi:hypothetical protein
MKGMNLMFFLKNDITVIQEEVIKKDICDKDGKVLVHINITYPTINLKEKSRLRQNAQPFYERSAKNFLHFAENDLLERAKKLVDKEGFRPCGAVMKFTCSYESKAILSIYTDVSVFDGVSEQNHLRSAQVWNKDKGFIYSFNDIFASGAKEILLENFASEGNTGILPADDYRKALRKFFVESNFYFTDKAAAFFYPAERLGSKQGVRVFLCDKETLKEKKLLKVLV